jgi:hypothetical protein
MNVLCLQDTELKKICEGKKAGDPCSMSGIVRFRPEECNPNLGNETCSTATVKISVICYIIQVCVCTPDDDMILRCLPAPDNEKCIDITTDPLVCHHEPCPPKKK